MSVGVVTDVFRYPVKSMAGQRLQSATLGWHGLEGDRRFAFLREGTPGGFPFLSASRLPALILYRPQLGGTDGEAPTVATPAGAVLALDGDALRVELSEALGSPVSLLRLDNGIFDDAPLSLITEATIGTLAGGAGRALDIRRFRPNIVVRTPGARPFPEDEWVGARLRFGEREDAPMMAVTHRDLRCSMVGLDPDTAAADPEILKTTVRMSETCAGVYGLPLRTGRIAVGDPVYLIG